MLLSIDFVGKCDIQSSENLTSVIFEEESCKRNESVKCEVNSKMAQHISYNYILRTAGHTNYFTIFFQNADGLCERDSSSPLDHMRNSTDGRMSPSAQTIGSPFAGHVCDTSNVLTSTFCNLP